MRNNEAVITEMEMANEELAVGDVVEWSHWSGTLRGVVVKVTPATATAKPNEVGFANKTFRRRKHGAPWADCRRVDVARERWHEALKAWWDDRPMVSHIETWPTLNYEWCTIGFRENGRQRPTLDSLLTLADEAHTIREWLRKRPVEPK